MARTTARASGAGRTPPHSDLYQGEKLWRQLVENSADAMVIVDGAGVIVLVNPRAEKMFGYPREALAGQPVEMLIPEHVRGSHLAHREGYFASPRPRAMGEGRDLSGRRQDGSEFPVTISLSPLQTDEGTLALATINDITARKTAEEALRASEKRWRLVVEQAADAMVMVGRDGHIRLVNDKAEEMFGYSQGDLLGKPIEMLIPERVAIAHLEHRRSFFENPRPRSMGLGLDLSGRRQDGSEFPVRISLGPLETEDDLVVLATISDVSESKAAEEALRASEKRWRLVVEQAADAMVMVGRDGYIRLVNVKAEEMFGYSQGDMVGKPIEMLIPERVAMSHLEHRRSFFSNPRPRSMGLGLDLLGRRRDGSEFPVSVSLGPLETEDDLVVLATISDITEVKLAQETLKALNANLNQYALELERSNAELQQFAYVSSHDLKEPLRMVTSYLTLLERRYKDQLDSDAQEFIGFAVDGATRMQDLINDLLAYSRVGTHGQPYTRVDCNTVVSEVLANLQIMVEEHHAMVETGLLPEVMADSTQLIALFQNLIANAIKFQSGGAPHVHIAAVRGDGLWTFSVKDNGIGIEAEYQDRIFVIFQRLHKRGEYPGTGIGLAICKKIVERHGGHIWLESTPGEGTTFFFTIPDSQES